MNESRGADRPETEDDLLGIAQKMLAGAQPSEQVEVMVSRGESTSVRVHHGEVESLTSAGTQGMGVRVVRDGRVGFASCGSLDPDVMAETLEAARDNVQFSEPDAYTALAEPDGVAVVEQDLWSQALVDMPVQAKVDMALRLERAVLGLDPRVTSARTTSWSGGWSQVALASTTGIARSGREAGCALATQPLAISDGETQIGWGSDSACDPKNLDVGKVASESVERATKLLGATKPESAKMPILLEPRLAITLFGMVAGMLSAEAVQKGRSPFADRVGEVIGSELLTIVDDPTRSESLGAEEWDGEGLACRSNSLLVGGVLQGFLYDSTTARRAGTSSTGSAVRAVRGLPTPGPQLLVMEPGLLAVSDLVAGVELGLAVESFTGLHSGVNPVSGDFSVGADGIMIRNGELAEPVRELTVASTLQKLLLGVVAVGNDFEWLPGGSGAASVLIEDVSISGS